MRRLSIPTHTSHQVRALFQASAAFFDLPATATFGDLAERVTRLGDHHIDPLSGIDVRSGSAAPWPGAGRRPVTSCWKVL
jgi:hypothetical protein